jgi:spermidine synthase
MQRVSYPATLTDRGPPVDPSATLAALPAKVPGRATYIGVFLVAMSTLVLEILITRITSVLAWYHLAFFVISLAMLGMTAGAVVVFVRPKWFLPDAIGRRLVAGSALLAIYTLAYGAALAVPFTVSGVVLTLALTRAGLPAGTVYGVDLVGAAAGCVLVIPLLELVDAPSGVLAASAVAALAGWSFSRDVESIAPKHRAGLIALVLALLALAGINVATTGAILRPHHVKGLEENPDVHLFSGWNTYSRVTVDDTMDLPPALWAPSRMIPAEHMRLLPQRFMKIDGAAGTMMAGFDTTPDDGVPGSLDEHAYLEWDVTSFAHRLRPDGPAAVIGVGGGRDVLEAARVGHDPVVGIELNALIVDLHEGEMREFSGVADLPGVQLVNDEARSYLARDDRKYSVITMSLIDTWAATGAGAYALSENGLYTVEGWRIFMSRLDDRGIFTVSRWYLPGSPGETARMLALAYETLWSLGAENPRRHIILLQNQAIATVLIARKPFTRADIDLVQKEAVARGFNMLLTPRRVPTNPVLRELAEIEDRDAMWQWARSALLDYTPPTDERPFFFNMLRPRSWLEAPDEVGELDHAFLGNLYATQTLVYSTLASAVLTLFAVAIPMFWRRRDLQSHGVVDLAASCLYFALIGLGFMFVEMALLSRLNVFLGHPTLALATLLGGIIFFTGVGSLLSGRIPMHSPVVARFYPVIPAALVCVIALAVDPVMSAFAGASTPVRALASVVIVGIPALGMGICFPLGLRLVGALAKKGRPDLGPWMWGVNGACGVVASGLALTCSMAWSITTTLFVGAVCYVALVASTTRLLRSSSTSD